MTRRITWGDPVDRGGIADGREIRGYISDLHVASVFPDRTKQGGFWWVTVHLAPLPYTLDQLTVTSKATERGAKAIAQRVVNAFTRLLTEGENA
jgi:hypothetical protein